MFFDLEPLLWLNCARHSVTGQTPRHFIPQKKQRQGWHVISWQTKLASFRQKTCRIKCHGGHFIPLSRVPLSLQPPHFVAVAGDAALPIGARLYLYSLATKRPFLTNLCLHIQKANISLCRPCHKCKVNHPCLPRQHTRQHFSLPCCSQKRKAFPPSATP